MSIFIFGVLMYFLQFWYCLVVHEDPSEFKVFILQPFLGPFHLADAAVYSGLSWILLLGLSLPLLRLGRNSPKWPVHVLHAVSLVAAMSLTYWGNQVRVAANHYDSDPIRSDQQMIEHFDKHRSSFDDLVVGLTKDSRIDNPNGQYILWSIVWRVDYERYRWYQERRRKTKVLREIEMHQDGRLFIFPAAVNAVGDHGTFKGYVYAEGAPSPLLPALDELPSQKTTFYRHIEDNWYLYCRNTN